MGPDHGATVTSLQGARSNDLLAGLPDAERAWLVPALQWVPLRLGDLLYEPGKPVRHAYFPSTAVVSLHLVTADGACVQTCSVGHEGMVGLPLFTGGVCTTSTALVHIGGHGWRLERQLLAQAFEQGGALRAALLRHAQCLMTQIAQTAACYRHHAIEQQLSSWLLATLDRVMPGDELVMTQELLGNLLGVRRESITQAATHLQQLGHIRYRRGHISVLDVAGLQACACECYGVMKLEMSRLAAQTPRARDGLPPAGG
jgi:CRP-like cAMP-binding protein